MKASVTVFGSSEPRESDPAYGLAYRTGQALARNGFTVITGGYGGVMEAASRGASEAGGHTVGVLSKIFSARDPNPYLSETVSSNDLYERTRLLIDRAEGYVVLAGRAGTLAELAWVWALARAGCLSGRPIVALGAPWPDLLDLLEEHDMLDLVAREMTERAADENEAVTILKRRIPGIRS
jgi:uncharacterized protein (TIGR00725 family)